MTAGVTFLNNDELYREIYDKLVSGWAVLYGHVGAFSYVENELYKPGTKANANFEIIGTIRPIALCKKTKKFNQMFKINRGMEITALCAYKDDGEPRILFQILEAPDDEYVTDRYSQIASASKNYLINGEFKPN